MAWIEGMLHTRGKVATIQRTPKVTTRVSLKRSSGSRDPASRDSGVEGYVLSDALLKSGELFVAGTDTYLTQSVEVDDGGDFYFALKCNATITHQRYTESVDENWNRTQSWATLATSSAWIQVVTARMRGEDPGLVDNARYVLQVPASLGVAELDRIVIGATNYKVESVDDVAMSGVDRVQLSIDTRP